MSFPFSTVENIQNALQFIPSDERDICVKMGMAVKSALGDPGYPLWDEWLQTGDGYKQRDMLAVWKSITPGSVTVATLFYEAKQNGFQFDKGSCLTSVEIDNRKHLQRIARQKSEQEEMQRQVRNEQRIEQVLSQLLPNGEPMVKYFQNRGLGRFEIPESLKFHPGLDYWDNGTWLGQFPAVVSLVTDEMNKLVTLHVIYLSNDGHKAPVSNPKKILPVITTITGAAAKFSMPDNELYVCEGIETALAVMLATKMPVWAGLTAHGLGAVNIPETVTIVRVMADKDRSGAGEIAAKKLAQRLMLQGATVYIVIPVQSIPDGEKSIDWLDVFNMNGVTS